MDLWNGEVYDAHSRLQQEIAEQFLKELKGHFPLLHEGAVVLDVGCGNGRVTFSIMESFGDIQVIGIDSSQDMIDFANTHFASSRMQFFVDKAEELKKIDSCTIDAITSFSCLHWVWDQQSAFQRMYEVLKPGGWVGFTFPGETGFDDRLDYAFAQAMQEQPFVHYFDQAADENGWYNAKPKTVKTQLQEIGFQEIVVDVLNFDFYFEDRLAFRDWIIGSAQQLKLLPKELQEQCADRIVSLYLDSTADRQPQNQQCIYQVDAMKVWAVKPF